MTASVQAQPTRRNAIDDLADTIQPYEIAELVYDCFCDTWGRAPDPDQLNQAWHRCAPSMYDWVAEAIRSMPDPCPD
jgi:hypothetical protein